MTMMMFVFIVLMLMVMSDFPIASDYSYGENTKKKEKIEGNDECHYPVGTIPIGQTYYRRRSNNSD